MTKSLKSIFPGILVVFISLFAFLGYVDLMTNDDIFVYFNYARNMVEGRWFAIDSRNIPSEGFTSILYMLFLVPFYYFKVDMMVSGAILNYISILLSSWLIASCFKKVLPDFEVKEHFVTLFLFLLFLIDKNLLGIAGWAFESWYSPLFFSACLYALFSWKETEKGHFEYLFVIFYCLGILIRPENLVIYGPLFLGYFVFQKNKRKWFGLSFPLVGFLLAWFLFKYLVFGDFFPTGFYRKMMNKVQGDSGLSYLIKFFTEYQTFYLVLGAFLLVALIFIKNLKLNQRFLVFLGILICSSFLNLLFVIKVTPLVGVFFRYLILLNFCSKIVFAGLIFWAVGQFSIRISALRQWGFLIILLPFLFAFRNPKFRKVPDLDIFQKAHNQYFKHPYIQFGMFLKKEYPQVSEITISMIDGGAVPFVLQSKTVDPAGLTEPYLARLTASKAENKVDLYWNYWFQFKPDLLLLTTGQIGSAALPEEMCSSFLHIPLNSTQYIELLNRASSHGYRYLGTWKNPFYDWHFVVRENSPFIKPLSNALLKFVQKEGYFKSNGYSIVCGKDSKVHFFPLAKNHQP